VVRDDLPLGILAAQVVHAAGETSTGELQTGTSAVVLTASQDGLLELSARLDEVNVPHKLVRESDYPYSGQLMALGVRPERRSKLKKYLSSLPLLR